MHTDRDVKNLFEFRVSQNMIGMAMGVQDIFDLKAFCFNQSQKFVFLSGRINNNRFAGMGAYHQISHYLKRPQRDLFYDCFCCQLNFLMECIGWVNIRSKGSGINGSCRMLILRIIRETFAKRPLLPNSGVRLKF